MSCLRFILSTKNDSAKDVIQQIGIRVFIGTRNMNKTVNERKNLIVTG